MKNLSHPSFETIRCTPIETLNVEVQEFRHKATGASHFHFACENQENVFLVGFRTVPHDSSGVAHILEHTVLCGSERYPVRDPFFMMIRRSLNTFMNAFTSSDWTAYPFASKNKKDFQNLLEVYLDAVFFSNLNELDFMQEGHRLEFESDPSSPLLYKGVVFNEMKGAMGSDVSRLWQTLTKYVFPTSTYHFNSGGEPIDIPSLKYQDLISFYKTHYHPSNTIFMTYGDLAAKDLQEQFESLALSRFQSSDANIHVDREQRYLSPLSVEEFYPYESGESLENKTHIVMGWLLGESNNIQEQFTAHLISGVLMDNSASPLMHALETTDLAASPSPLCGLEDSNREMLLVCGVEGSEAKHAEAIEKLILDVLQDVADNGIPQDQAEAVLHQFELEQREIGGGSYPYGLQIILEALPAVIHRQDPVAMLDIDQELATLREKIKDPEFIKQCVRKLLLDNQHRVRLVMKPDPDLARRTLEAERARLAQIRQGLDDAQCQALMEKTQQLKQRQQQEDDMEILPKVGIADIPEDMYIATGEQLNSTAAPLMQYAQATNGLSYLQVVNNMPALDEEHLTVFPYFTNCFTEIGFGDHDYLSAQSIQASVSGGVNSYSSLRPNVDDSQSMNAFVFLSSKSLNRNNEKMVQLLYDMYYRARFDETDRIKELIAQLRSHREQSVIRNGHSLAMQAATSGFAPSAAIKHKLSGLQGLKHIKQLDQALQEDPQAIYVLCDKFAEIHKKLLAEPYQFVAISEESQLSDFVKIIRNIWSDEVPGKGSQLSAEPTRHQVRQAWLTNTPVNFCAAAYPTVTLDHADAPALTVLGGFLRNGFLHSAIREKGGAYGSGASYQSDIAAFRFHSYRDPRLKDTLQDFSKSLEWLASDKHEDRLVEEAILGVISAIDKPSSPAGEAKDAFQNQLFGRTPELRRSFRAKILNVTLNDLQRVGETYFKPDDVSIAVITNSENSQVLNELNLEQIQL